MLSAGLGVIQVLLSLILTGLTPTGDFIDGPKATHTNIIVIQTTTTNAGGLHLLLVWCIGSRHQRRFFLIITVQLIHPAEIRI